MSRLRRKTGKLLKAIDEIETGKPIFGGKVTLFKEDYGDVTDLARKQIATESKESELSAEIIRLKKDNTKAIPTETGAAQGEKRVKQP